MALQSIQYMRPSIIKPLIQIWKKAFLMKTLSIGKKGGKSLGGTEEGLLFQSGHTSKCVDILCIEKNSI